MIVEILKEVKEKNNHVVTLIGDDDCTAFNRARCEVSSCIVKLNDKNHVKKNISYKLYRLKKSEYRTTSHYGFYNIGLNST